MADWRVGCVVFLWLGVRLTIRVPGGQWPVDWQVCLVMGWMGVVVAPWVWRRRHSRERMYGSIVVVWVIVYFRWARSTVVLIRHLEWSL